MNIHWLLTTTIFPSACSTIRFLHVSTILDPAIHIYAFISFSFHKVFIWLMTWVWNQGGRVVVVVVVEVVCSLSYGSLLWYADVASFSQDFFESGFCLKNGDSWHSFGIIAFLPFLWIHFFFQILSCSCWPNFQKISACY